MNNKKIEQSTGLSQTNKLKRRQLITAFTGLGVAGTLLPKSWTKPVINSVVLPAHAQMSCPQLVAMNVLVSTVSPQTSPARCSVTFDLLSADPGVALNIVSITNSTLVGNTTVNNDGVMVATADSGPRVTWQGAALNAPFCNIDSTPNDDVTFTVMSTCELLDDVTSTQEFSLLDIFRQAELGNT